jgi:3-deoxy-manno-octulosonate cytidylyltransferase (CMP-KDO synthetase)
MVLGIIPARYASTRFPGKPLAVLDGKTMIQRVVEQAQKATLLDRIAVATDDERIYQHVRSFGGEVWRTRVAHPSGTDRCAEVAKHFPKAQYVLNIQGDEPFVQPGQIDLLVDTLISHRQFPIATLAKLIEQPDLLHNPNIVKVVFSALKGAVYFSRHPIPYVRNHPPDDWLRHHAYYKHIGLYGFRRTALLRIAKMAPTPLEKAESLEQLRWLEHGLRIAVGITTLETIGIDTPEDLVRATGR